MSLAIGKIVRYSGKNAKKVPPSGRNERPKFVKRCFFPWAARDWEVLKKMPENREKIPASDYMKKMRKFSHVNVSNYTKNWLHSFWTYVRTSTIFWSIPISETLGRVVFLQKVSNLVYTKKLWSSSQVLPLFYENGTHLAFSWKFLVPTFTSWLFPKNPGKYYNNSSCEVL